jgi:hypothetical protein
MSQDTSVSTAETFSLLTTVIIPKGLPSVSQRNSPVDTIPLQPLESRSDEKETANPSVPDK